MEQIEKIETNIEDRALKINQKIIVLEENLSDLKKEETNEENENKIISITEELKILYEEKDALEKKINEINLKKKLFLEDSNKIIPRLYQVKGKNKLFVQSFIVSCDSLYEDGAFVFDSGESNMIFIWIGKKASNKKVQMKASTVADLIKNSRKGLKIERLDNTGSDEFWELLGGKTTVKKTATEIEDYENNCKLFRISDTGGRFKATKLLEGNLTYDKLESQNLYLIDASDMIYLWVGKECKSKNGGTLAKSFLGYYRKPNWTPIIKFDEGKEGNDFFEIVSKHH